MAIYKKDNLFYLVNDYVSLIIEEREGYLFTKHFGGPIREYHYSNTVNEIDHSFSPNPTLKDRTFSLDTQRNLIGQWGRGDFRKPSIILRHTNNMTTEFKYLDYSIQNENLTPEGLPAPYAGSGEAETLIIHLADSVLDLQLNLYYTLYKDSNTIGLYKELINNSEEEVIIEKIHSFILDAPKGDYDAITFNGAYGREKLVQRQEVKQGYYEHSSSRGASGHGHTPSIILADKATTDYDGEVVMLQLMYSGNFQAYVQSNQLQEVRLGIGINEEHFSWSLKSKDSFQTPVALLSHSNKGLNDLTQSNHDFIRRHVLPPKFSQSLRPILINNWEATYFNFNRDKLVELIDTAADVGIELFVLDDGWFGQRSDDYRALGDWIINEEKLGGPLTSLIEYVHSKNMKFGIWIEPEMISEDSELYRQHPEWVIRLPHRPHTFSRSQLVLDLSNREVLDFLKKTFDELLCNYDVDYVKWDMNRNITDIGNGISVQETLMQTHKHMLGVYELMSFLTEKHEDVLFESCAGGGGRNDLGVMRYFPQVWISDNTDAVERIKIQTGHSFLYPAITMGSHVSDVPNHQMNRMTPLETRGHIAMMGNLGYELDLTLYNNEELAVIKQQITNYKQIRPIIQFGKLTRLISSYNNANEVAMQYSYQEEIILVYARVLSMIEIGETTVKLKGVDEKAHYIELGTGHRYSGAELKYAGLTMALPRGDFLSQLFHFKKV